VAVARGFRQSADVHPWRVRPAAGGGIGDGSCEQTVHGRPGMSVSETGRVNIKCCPAIQEPQFRRASV